LVAEEAGMALSPISIVERRREALLAMWRQDPLIMVQVESPAALPLLMFLDDRGAKVELGGVGSRRQADTVIASRSGDPDRNASVWVRATYRGYRTAYVGFLNQVYGTQATTSDLGGYDIDHLLNRARSPGGAGFIRIEAIRSDVNQAWGRLFEKTASDPGFYANRHRLRRTLSWVICAKLGNQHPPTGPADTAGIDRLVAFFRGVGFGSQEAREGLTGMLNFAYGVR
jgi:hypothetical protein